MAKIVMKDGTSRVVDYNTAAHIYQIKLGNEKPKNKEQAVFCTKVEEVIFDQPSTGRAYYSGSGDLGERFRSYRAQRDRDAATD